MTNTDRSFSITPELAGKLIAIQFPEYAHLPITSVEKQGHDNRTYRLGQRTFRVRLCHVLFNNS